MTKKYKHNNAQKLKFSSNNTHKLSLKEKIWLILSGSVIGILNGFFGGGGGMVCVPILEKVLKLQNMPPNI